jgi:hypothetical protein
MFSGLRQRLDRDRHASPQVHRPDLARPLQQLTTVPIQIEQIRLATEDYLSCYPARKPDSNTCWTPRTKVAT